MDETIPEIQRTNLANTILYLKALGINNILNFDFLDKPSNDQVLQALTQLYALQALNKLGEITSLGRKMSSFPLDPSLSRMLIEAYCHPACQYEEAREESEHKQSHSVKGCWKEMVMICAMLSVENVWNRPRARHDILNRHTHTGMQNNTNINPNSAQSRIQMNQKGWGMPSLSVNSTETNSNTTNGHPNRVYTQEEERCEIAYAGLRHEYGDLLTLLNVFATWERAGRSFEWCERNFINHRSMKMAKKIRYTMLTFHWFCDF